MAPPVEFSLPLDRRVPAAGEGGRDRLSGQRPLRSGEPDRPVERRRAGKDRLYRTLLDQLRQAQQAIENDLKERYGVLFGIDYDLLHYDLTSSYFEGLAEDNDLARRGYSRDHRGDCQQVVIALIVSREGFPLAHYTLAGNTRDLETVEHVVGEVERRFGRAKGVWVMDRGMISKDTVKFLSRPAAATRWLPAAVN
jgi:transposase